MGIASELLWPLFYAIASDCIRTTGNYSTRKENHNYNRSPVNSHIVMLNRWSKTEESTSYHSNCYYMPTVSTQYGAWREIAKREMERKGQHGILTRPDILKCHELLCSKEAWGSPDWILGWKNRALVGGQGVLLYAKHPHPTAQNKLSE